MSRVIHESKPARYVVERRGRGEDQFEPWRSFTGTDRAIQAADSDARDNPDSEYRVMDTNPEVNAEAEALTADQVERAAEAYLVSEVTRHPHEDADSIAWANARRLALQMLTAARANGRTS